MVSWHDEARPKLANGREAWLTAPQVALSHVHLTPAELPDIWLVEVVIDGGWESIELPLRGVMALLLEWREDPEAALMNYWGRDPPERRPVADVEAPLGPREIITTTVASPEDLGL